MFNYNEWKYQRDAKCAELFVILTISRKFIKFSALTSIPNFHYYSIELTVTFFLIPYSITYIFFYKLIDGQRQEGRDQRPWNILYQY